MTFDEYRVRVRDAVVGNPEWRPGQAAFNVLADVRPDLANAVRGRTTDLDPFYIHDNIDRFYDFVRTNWDLTRESTT